MLTHEENKIIRGISDEYMGIEADIIRQQLDTAKVTDRWESGCGLFVELNVEPGCELLPLALEPSPPIPVYLWRNENLIELSFFLIYSNGYLDTLEGCGWDPWPSCLTGLSLSKEYLSRHKNRFTRGSKPSTMG
jgi:hypothetical protein